MTFDFCIEILFIEILRIYFEIFMRISNTSEMSKEGVLDLSCASFIFIDIDVDMDNQLMASLTIYIHIGVVVQCITS